MEPQKIITPPPNDLATSFTLTDPVTIMFWICMADQVGHIFLRYCTNYRIGIPRDNSEKFHLWVFDSQSLVSQNPQTFLVCNFHIDKFEKIKIIFVIEMMKY